MYSADYTGWADIDSGVKGVVGAHYYFSGEQDTVRFFPLLSLLLISIPPFSRIVTPSLSKKTCPRKLPNPPPGPEYFFFFCLVPELRTNFFPRTQGSTKLELQGPFTGKYVKKDDVQVSVWSPCGQSTLLNVNAEVALTPLGSGASGQLAVNKETGRFANQLYLRWKQC